MCWVRGGKMTTSESYDDIMKWVKVIHPMKCADICEGIAKHQGTMIYRRLKKVLPPSLFSQVVGAVSAGVMESLPQDIRYQQADIINSLVVEFFCNVIPEQQPQILQSCSSAYWQTVKTQMLLLKVQEELT